MPKYFRGLGINPIFKGQLRNYGSVHPLSMKFRLWRSMGIHRECGVKKLHKSLMGSGFSLSLISKVSLTITEDHFQPAFLFNAEVMVIYLKYPFCL